MSWWGKGLGLAFGYVAAGPLGALLGGALGYSADRGFVDRHARWRGGAVRRGVPGRILEDLFALMGALARLDGGVSQAQADWAEGLMRRLRLMPSQRQRMRAAFNAGRDPGFPLQSRIMRLGELVARDEELAANALRTLMDLARCDGAITPAEARMIHRCGALFGKDSLWTTGQLGERTPSGNGSLHEAFRVLGLDERAPDHEVKRAYRRAMHRAHPDRLGPEASEAARRGSAERVTEVRRAWERIRNARGLR